MIFVLLEYALEIALVPTMGYYWGLNVAAIVSMFVATLVVGYIFAGKIHDDKMGSIGQLLALSTAVLIFATMMGFSANGSYSAYVEDSLKSRFSDTASWTPVQWYSYKQMVLVGQLTFNAVLVLVLGFIGLYVGSMLKRPVKS